MGARDAIKGVVGVGVLPFELDLCNAYEMSIVAGGSGGGGDHFISVHTSAPTPTTSFSSLY